MAGRAVAVGLIQISDLSDEIGLGVGDKVLHREATFATGHDVRASARKRRLRDDLRLGPDVVRLGPWIHLGSAPNEDDPERVMPLHAAPDQQAVAGLEDVERHERAGEEDRPQREERKKFAHASTVLWRSVRAGPR